MGTRPLPGMGKSESYPTSSDSDIGELLDGLQEVRRNRRQLAASSLLDQKSECCSIEGARPPVVQDCLSSASAPRIRPSWVDYGASLFKAPNENYTINFQAGHLRV